MSVCSTVTAIVVRAEMSLLSRESESGTLPTGKRCRFDTATGIENGIKTHTNERIVPNVKFNLFGTIGAKFKVARGRYRRQQTVFSTRLGFVHRHRFVCHRRCEFRNGLFQRNAMGDLTL
jgi:hypothetical protein